MKWSVLLTLALTFTSNIITGIYAALGSKRIDLFLDLYFLQGLVTIFAMKLPHLTSVEFGRGGHVEVLRRMIVLQMYSVLAYLPIALAYLTPQVDSSVPKFCRIIYWIFSIKIWATVVLAFIASIVFHSVIEFWSMGWLTDLLKSYREALTKKRDKIVLSRLADKLKKIELCDLRATDILPEVQECLQLSNISRKSDLFTGYLSSAFAILLSFDPRRPEYSEIIPKLSLEDLHKKSLLDYSAIYPLYSEVNDLVFCDKNRLVIQNGTCGICDQILNYKEDEQTRSIYYPSKEAKGSRLVFACLESGRYVHMNCALAKNFKYFFAQGYFGIYREGAFLHYAVNGEKEDNRRSFEEFITEMEIVIDDKDYQNRVEQPKEGRTVPIRSKMDIVLWMEDMRKVVAWGNNGSINTNIYQND